MLRIGIFNEPLPNGKAMELVHIRGGKFTMGSDAHSETKPVHKVIVGDFYIGKYPVTNKQYRPFVEETNGHFPEWKEEGNHRNVYTGSDIYYKRLGESVFNDKHPVVGISWLDAVKYCEWLSKRTGKIFRLPSESEWEYAARGGKENLGFRYPGSNKLKEVGWYRLNSHGSTKPVGLKWPNELGLYDMVGNVWEWCSDHWHTSYEGAPNDGSPWIENGDTARRVMRGGSWDLNLNDHSLAVRVRARYEMREVLIGFRIACSWQE